MSTPIPDFSSTESPVSSEPLESSPELSSVMDSSSVSGESESESSPAPSSATDSSSVSDNMDVDVTAAPLIGGESITYISMPADTIYGADSPFIGYDAFFALFAGAVVTGFVLSCLINLAGLAVGIVSRIFRKEV